jgi:hypothetical protein
VPDAGVLVGTLLNHRQDKIRFYFDRLIGGGSSLLFKII